MAKKPEDKKFPKKPINLRKLLKGSRVTEILFEDPTPDDDDTLGQLRIFFEGIEGCLFVTGRDMVLEWEREEEVVHTDVIITECVVK